MSEITFRGTPVHTVGTLPAVGAPAPDFTVTGAELADVGRDDFAGTTLVLNIFPSVDTGVCAASVRRFNAEAAGLPDAVVLNVSADLPFAQARFCGAEGIDAAVNGSVFRSEFGAAYGVTMSDGPLAGLLSRAVVVVGPDGMVRYTEQVPEIGQEPDYEAALAAARG